MPADSETALAPSSTIGILGGGQLGRMLAMAGARLGYRIAVLEPDPKCPAAQVANTLFANAYDDQAALEEFAFNCDAVTLEFENVPEETLQFLASHVPTRPGAEALRIAQDRLVEKAFLKQAGAPIVDHFDIEDEAIFDGALSAYGGDAIVKTRRMGYDGHGQHRLTPHSSDEDIAVAKAAALSVDCIMERVVQFTREISVMVARGADGSIVTFDAAENVHRASILRRSTVPATSDDSVQTEAKAVAERIAKELDYVGIMGVEFFELADGSLVVNEIAPRVHNSGHWTELACAVDQFEMHMRAVAGLPLPAPGRHSDCVMENLIGDDVDRVPELLAEPNTRVHLYGKRDVRQGRKMGHMTQLLKPIKT
ncbi:MAG: 5-(carboxyamino)imidazole ribonucleotide synthase [Pseudomonadota bacterium]